MDLQSHPVFVTYAVCAAILVLKMIGVGHYTGILRMRKDAFLNPEDAKAFNQSDEYKQVEHPDVERGLRAHRNDLESTLPFLAIGPVYLWMGPSAGLASGLIIGFTLLRIAFSLLYIGGIQPWRTIVFMLGELCLLVMLIQIIYLAL